MGAPSAPFAPPPGPASAVGEDSPRPTSRYRLPIGLKIWLAAKAACVACCAAGHPRIGLAVYLAPDPWFLWQIIKPVSQGFGRVVSRFQTSRREVWLTIDDGPDPTTTPRVLDLLDRHQARATFFVIGENVRRYPALAAEIVRRGHRLANHTDTHPCNRLWRSGPKRTAQEIERCNQAFAEAGVSFDPYFRPPVGIKTPFMHRALHRRNMTLVAWSARGFDSVVNPDTAAQRILKATQPGAIILLHEGNAQRVEVIERVLSGLAEAGLQATIPSSEQLI